VRQWKALTPKEIQIIQGIYINNVLFADGQVILAKTENNLRKGLYVLNNSALRYDFKFLALAFCVKYPVR
jgi:hypothetical protein